MGSVPPCLRVVRAGRGPPPHRRCHDSVRSVGRMARLRFSDGESPAQRLSKCTIIHVLQEPDNSYHGIVHWPYGRHESAGPAQLVSAKLHERGIE